MTNKIKSPDTILSMRIAGLNVTLSTFQEFISEKSLKLHTLIFYLEIKKGIFQKTKSRKNISRVLWNENETDHF